MTTFELIFFCFTVFIYTAVDAAEYSMTCLTVLIKILLSSSLISCSSFPRFFSLSFLQKDFFELPLIMIFVGAIPLSGVLPYPRRSPFYLFNFVAKIGSLVD